MRYGNTRKYYVRLHKNKVNVNQWYTNYQPLVEIYNFHFYHSHHHVIDVYGFGGGR